MMGAVTSFIAVQNDGRARNQIFGRSGEYWRSRARAMANLMRGKPPWHRDHRPGIAVP